MRRRVAWGAAAWLLLARLALGAGGVAGVLAEGTECETPYFAADSGRKGPTVVVVGGVHGNEPAGARAAEQIRGWTLLRGRMVVVPRANVAGLGAEKRRITDGDGEWVDLNRLFPTAKRKAAPSHALAADLWRLVQREKPDWLIDLHEGYDYVQQGGKSVGASIIHTGGPLNPTVDRMLAAVNATIEEEDRRMVALRRSGPIAGSLANAAEELGIKAMIVETCYKDERLPVRVRQHRVMMGTLLHELGMVGAEADRRLAPTGSEALRVGVYDDGGVGGGGRAAIERLMRADGVIVRRFDAVDVRRGVLDQFDVVVFSGGSGSGQAKSLEGMGTEAVKRYVDRGGGYVGICGGAYLATAGYRWSLGIVDARTLHEGDKWRRGTGTVRIEQTDAGRAVLGAVEGGAARGETIDVHYANGPIVGPANREALRDYEVLAWFRTELAENGSKKGLMVDSPAIIAGRYGGGRVVSISPHLEQTQGLEALVRRAVMWAAQREPEPVTAPLGR